MRSTLLLIASSVCAVALLAGCAGGLASTKETAQDVAAAVCAKLPEAQVAVDVAQAAVAALPPGTDKDKAVKAAAQAELVLQHVKAACAFVPPAE